MASIGSFVSQPFFLIKLLLLFTFFVKVRCQFFGFGANIILCWRCEEPECNRFFDFTQHTAEQCDGKCWKSYDIIEAKTKEEREQATGWAQFNLISLRSLN